MTVTILVPVLGRPGRVGRVIANIEEATPEPHDVLFIADTGDWDERLELDRLGAHYITTDMPPPNYPVKMNLGYRATVTEFVFLAADDVVFHRGWLSAALAEMRDKIAVVGTNDGGVNPLVAKGQHATHMLVRRAYIDDRGATYDAQPGVLVHEGYRHAYVDDELVRTAKRVRAYAHAHQSVVEHLHPYATTAEMDHTYEIGQQHIALDQAEHVRRRRSFRKGSAAWMSPSSSRPSERTSG